MQGAVLNGLFGAKPSPVFNCTSSCIWNDPFVSLGFASTCKNVTQETLTTKVCKNEADHLGDWERCNMTTPTNVTLSTFLVRTESQTTLVVAAEPLWGGTSGNYSLSPTTEFMRIAVLRAPLDDAVNDDHIEGEEITECTLRPVAYQYSGITATGSNFTVAATTQLPLELEPSARNRYVPGIDGSVTLQHAGLPPLAISTADWAAVAEFFASDLFIGNITLGNSLTTSSDLRTPFMTGDVAAKFDAIAASMTEYVRSGPGSQLALGSRVVSTVMVRVQWVWLALPPFRGRGSGRAPALDDRGELQDDGPAVVEGLVPRAAVLRVPG